MIAKREGHLDSSMNQVVDNMEVTRKDEFIVTVRLLLILGKFVLAEKSAL